MEVYELLFTTVALSAEVVRIFENMILFTPGNVTGHTDHSISHLLNFKLISSFQQPDISIKSKISQFSHHSLYSQNSSFPFFFCICCVFLHFVTRVTDCLGLLIFVSVGEGNTVSGAGDVMWRASEGVCPPGREPCM